MLMAFLVLKARPLPGIGQSLLWLALPLPRLKPILRFLPLCLLQGLGAIKLVPSCIPTRPSRRGWEQISPLLAPSERSEQKQKGSSCTTKFPSQLRLLFDTTSVHYHSTSGSFPPLPTPLFPRPPRRRLLPGRESPFATNARLLFLGGKMRNHHFLLFFFFCI